MLNRRLSYRGKTFLKNLVQYENEKILAIFRYGYFLATCISIDCIAYHRVADISNRIKLLLL